MKINKILILSAFVLLILLVFPFLFRSSPITGGDYLNFWPENLLLFKNYAFSAWNSEINLGWGTIGLLHYAPYSFLTGWVGYLAGNNILLWERLVWWLPFFVLSFFSIYTLFTTIFSKNSFWFFAPLIFIFNTYIFMLLGGGQIAGLGLAYAIAPLVLSSFIKLINTKTNQFTSALITGVLLAVLVVLDLRIAYVILLAVFLYFLFNLLYLDSKEKLKSLLQLSFYTFVIPFGITGLLHAFWILPMILFRVNTIEQLGTAYSSLDAVKFFSFAKFENTISLLHPNWPENLFGKTYFMRWEFLFIPIFAFSSLLFIEKKISKYILFFSFLALVSAFLAKGSNDPFGGIYLWLFDHIPGFIMFRDPTKFYILVILSYCILIPFTISSLFNFLRIKFKNYKYISYLFIFLCAGYFLYLINPAFTGNLSGIFRAATTAPASEELKIFLSKDPHFFRTLWLPHRGKFAYFIGNHPAVDADTFLRVSSPSGVLSVLKKPENEKRFQEAGVKYVILPEDPQKELFMKDNKYNQNLREQYEKELNKIAWLKKSQEFEKISVYEITSSRDKFWMIEKRDITYQTVDPTTYNVSINNAKKGEVLVFNESYDGYWSAKETNTRQEIMSKPYNKLYNSFVLPHDGGYEFVISYKPQKWVSIGGYISLVTLVAIGVLILKKKR